MINIIIFSKDRACQLDLLLRSIKKLWPDYNDNRKNIIHIVWTASRLHYYESYRKLERIYGDEFVFTKQTKFYVNMEQLNENKPHTMFLVDDLVFKEPFTLDCEEYEKFKKNTDIMAMSLRLDTGINYCYTQNKPMTIPIFRMKNIWEWQGKDYDWGYPWSIDGNIFRTEDLIKIIRNSRFFSPNAMESSLIRYMPQRPYMICFDKAKVINNPANKVGKFNNRYGKIDFEFLNNKFLSGQRIALEPIIGMKSNSCHKEFEYIYENAIY